MITYAYFWSFFCLGWILAQLVIIATINATIKNPDRALIVYGLINGALILLFVKLVESLNS
jgi:hypothetical protein